MSAGYILKIQKKLTWIRERSLFMVGGAGANRGGKNFSASKLRGGQNFSASL